MCLSRGYTLPNDHMIARLANADYAFLDDLTLNEQFAQDQDGGRIEVVERLPDIEEEASQVEESVSEYLITPELDHSGENDLISRPSGQRLEYMNTSVYGIPDEDCDTVVRRTIDAVKYVSTFQIDASHVEESLLQFNCSILGSARITLYNLIHDQLGPVSPNISHYESLYYITIAIDILTWVEELRAENDDYNSPVSSYVNYILRRVHNLSDYHELSW